ncbi:hypothetical protein [Bradyrhizobium liaoningense]|uniref:hypothetical protein n=1 Tax=Bradyrhizobium liaoningense TaxID=43992 RepID=UPI0020130E07|nr:hypothetical protein [Bradyrhizobium liaoningense]
MGSAARPQYSYGSFGPRERLYFAVQYQRLVNPVSGAVALGTLLAAATLPVVVVIVAGR